MLKKTLIKYPNHFRVRVIMEDYEDTYYEDTSVESEEEVEELFKVFSLIENHKPDDQRFMLMTIAFEMKTGWLWQTIVYDYLEEDYLRRVIGLEVKQFSEDSKLYKVEIDDSV